MSINIGELIADEMKRQNITQGQLARMIGCQRTNVINILKRNSINTDLLMSICRALHCNFFKLLAEEAEQERMPNPKRVLRESILGFRLHDDEKGYFDSIEDLAEGYQEIDVLDIGLNINGVHFDETLELPEEFCHALNYAYCCALDGELRFVGDDELDIAFFPWLLRNHPRLAGWIQNEVEELLTQRIEEDVEGTYRDVINYEGPNDWDEWYELGENNIKYLMGNLSERIRKSKRPIQWLQPTFDF